MTIDDFKQGDKVTHQTMGHGEVVAFTAEGMHVVYEKGGRGIYCRRWFEITPDLLAIRPQVKVQ